MELLTAAVVGILFATGTYLMLARRLLRVVLGTALLGHGVNLMLLTSGRLKQGGVPILGGAGGPYTDPLPQALILTAIVIGFGVTALLIVLAYRVYQEHQTDDLGELRGTHDEG